MVAMGLWGQPHPLLSHFYFLGLGIQIRVWDFVVSIRSFRQVLLFNERKEKGRKLLGD